MTFVVKNWPSLRIIGPSYGGVWLSIGGFWDLQTISFEIPWFLGFNRSIIQFCKQTCFVGRTHPIFGLVEVFCCFLKGKFKQNMVLKTMFPHVGFCGILLAQVWFALLVPCWVFFGGGEAHQLPTNHTSCTWGCPSKRRLWHKLYVVVASKDLDKKSP